jgi:hypothetical protein
MRFFTNKFALASAALAAIVLTTPTIKAETIKVPFSFTVAGHNMLPGYYTVQRDESLGMVTLKTADASKTFTWVLGPGEPGPNDFKVALKFDADTHALRAIQYGSKVTARLDKGNKETAVESARLSQGR